MREMPTPELTLLRAEMASAVAEIDEVLQDAARRVAEPDWAIRASRARQRYRSGLAMANAVLKVRNMKPGVEPVTVKPLDFPEVQRLVDMAVALCGEYNERNRGRCLAALRDLCGDPVERVAAVD